jgi:hypothetical protein
MVDSFRKTVIASGAVGIGISLALFFASWWMHAFDLLVVPQFPGFLIASSCGDIQVSHTILLAMGERYFSHT